jgi:hypothetical protein
MAAQGHKPMQAARPHSCSYSCAANSGLFRCVTTYHLLNKLHTMICEADLCTHHTSQDHLHQLNMSSHRGCLDRSAAAGARALHSAYPSCIARLPRILHNAFVITALIHPVNLSTRHLRQKPTWHGHMAAGPRAPSSDVSIPTKPQTLPKHVHYQDPSLLEIVLLDVPTHPPHTSASPHTGADCHHMAESIAVRRACY